MIAAEQAEAEGTDVGEKISKLIRSPARPAGPHHRRQRALAEKSDAYALSLCVVALRIMRMNLPTCVCT